MSLSFIVPRDCSLWPSGLTRPAACVLLLSLAAISARGQTCSDAFDVPKRQSYIDPFGQHPMSSWAVDTVVTGSSSLLFQIDYCAVNQRVYWANYNGWQKWDEASGLSTRAVSSFTSGTYGLQVSLDGSVLYLSG